MFYAETSFVAARSGHDIAGIIADCQAEPEAA